MNSKDLKRTIIAIDEKGHVFLAVTDAAGKITPLQRPATEEFLQVMNNFLLNKSGNGVKPVIISRGGVPTFKITIQPADEIVPAAASLMKKPGQV